MPTRRLALLALVLAACHGKKAQPPHPQFWCPGQAGCTKGSDGTLAAGFAAVAITPAGYEKPRPDFLLDKGGACDEAAEVDPADGLPHCGALTPDAWSDCGLDHLCPGDVGYPGKDAGEGDGVPDFFRDCGRDGLCPGDPGYAGPDADGSEGDGKFEGYWLAGFDNNRPMNAVHDDLWARAMVLRSGDVTIAFVELDLVGFFWDDVDRVRRRVAALAPGEVDYVLVGATHTHEGPDALGQWGPVVGAAGYERGVDDDWLTNVVVEGAAQAAVKALRAAQPAKLYAAQAHVGQETPSLISDTRDPWIADDALTVLRLAGAQDGKTLGTFVSFGNHPETVASGNNAATGDFVGYVRDGVEKGLALPDGTPVAQGEGGTCVFFQGALGGMMTPLHAHPQALDGSVPRDGTFAKAQAVGQQLAKVALGALATAPEIASPRLAFGAQTLHVKVENTVMQFAMSLFGLFHRSLYDYDARKAIGSNNVPSVNTEIAKIEVGPVRFVAVPGELFPELAVGYDAKWSFGQPRVKPSNPNPPDLSKAPPDPYLKDLLGGDIPCVLGLAGDELGYFVPPYDYQLSAGNPYFDRAPGDHYEETNSLGPSVVPALLDAYKRLLAWEPAR